MIRKWIGVLLAAVLACGLAGCGQEEEVAQPPVQEEPGALEPVSDGTAAEVLAQLDNREKVGQLFFVRPEALEPALTPQDLTGTQGPGVTEVSPEMAQTLQTYPVGGVVLFEKNLTGPEQLEALQGDLNRNSRVPVAFATEEEGGAVARLANASGFSLPTYPNMGALGQEGDPAPVVEAARTMGGYLKDHGIVVNFAPVADVNSNPENPAVGPRAFSDDPEQAAMLVSAAVDGFHQGGVACVVKHFPGLGGTTGQENGLAVTSKTWEELALSDRLPFQAGMAAGADGVMVGHILTPNVTGDGLPASLSQELITGKLRQELRYSRLVFTDPLEAEAITGQYTPAEAALLAFQAGADVLVMPEDLPGAFQGILEAVEQGEISQARLDESVLRILTLKETYGLLA